MIEFYKKEIFDYLGKKPILSTSSTKNEIRTELVTTRFCIRELISSLLDKKAQLGELEKLSKTYKKQGITFLPVEAQISECEKAVTDSYDLLVDCGEEVVLLMDLWQIKGATFRDLCDLCSVSYHIGLKEIEELEDLNLSEVVFILHFDYRHNNSDFVDLEYDGPFTHALMARFCKELQNNSLAKAAARQALEECFPELWDKRMYESTDSEGNAVMVDKDGEIIYGLEE